MYKDIIQFFNKINPKYCKVCKAKNPYFAKFCGYCGTNIGKTNNNFSLKFTSIFIAFSLLIIISPIAEAFITFKKQENILIWEKISQNIANTLQTDLITAKTIISETLGYIPNKLEKANKKQIKKLATVLKIAYGINDKTIKEIFTKPHYSKTLFEDIPKNHPVYDDWKNLLKSKINLGTRANISSPLTYKALYSLLRSMGKKLPLKSDKIVTKKEFSKIISAYFPKYALNKNENNPITRYEAFTYINKIIGEKSE